MFTMVLVPLDHSALAEQAIAPATTIARASGGTLSLVLAHDSDAPHGIADSTWRGSSGPEETIYINALVNEIRARAGVTVNGVVEPGAPADVIRRRSADIGADLIVMTSHGRTGLSRAWMGSVADTVVREASVPVLMLRPTERAPEHAPEHAPEMTFRRILVPLDDSPASMAILGPALKLARCTGATLVLVRVVIPVMLYMVDGLAAYPTTLADPDSTQQVADQARERLTEVAVKLEREHGIRVETDVVVGDRAATSILETATAKNADLIAMTTHGRGASRLIVGSVTDKVLRGGHLPLLLLHPHATAPERFAEPVSVATPRAFAPA